MLGVAIMFQDYQDALTEIDSLGLEQVWREFFNTRQQLYRVENRSSKFRVRSQVVVGQNRKTDKQHRDAMNCIWKRAMVTDYVGPLCLL